MSDIEKLKHLEMEVQKYSVSLSEKSAATKTKLYRGDPRLLMYVYFP